MNGDALSIGTVGSLIANLLLLAIMENVSPPPWWSRPYAPLPVEADRTTSMTLINTWRPFVDDPGGGGQRRKSCPEPRANYAGGAVPVAPLPAGYDPYAPLEQPFHACLLVAGDGTILRAKLLGSSGSAGTDGRILALISTKWRANGPGAGEAPAWQRVRLNAGPDEDEVREAYSMY